MCSSDLADERISDLEDKIVKITTAEQNKVKRMKRTEDSLRDLWDNMKRSNIRIIGVPEEEKKKKGTEKMKNRVLILLLIVAESAFGEDQIEKTEY